MGAVFFATPAYDRHTVVEFTSSLIDTHALLQQYGVEAKRAIITGDCYVHKARNSLVSDFWNSGADVLFYLDSDLGWDPHGVLKLLTLPYEFACGIYPYKNDIEGYPADLDLVDGKPHFDQATGCVRMTCAPTGFWRLRRSVIEKMMPFSEGYWCFGKRHQNFFKTPVLDGEFFGEDTKFCRDWRSIGGEIWAYPDINFHHVGAKAWKGNYLDFLTRQEDAKAEYESWLPKSVLAVAA